MYIHTYVYIYLSIYTYTYISIYTNNYLYVGWCALTQHQYVPILSGRSGPKQLQRQLLQRFQKTSKHKTLQQWQRQRR